MTTVHCHEVDPAKDYSACPQWEDELGGRWTALLASLYVLHGLILVVAVYFAFVRNVPKWSFPTIGFSIIITSSLVRLVWLIDPAGFEDLFGAATRTCLLRIPQILLFVMLLLFIAVWKRVSGAKYRIKSAFLVGKYKVPLAVLVTVLLLTVPLSVLAAFGVIESVVHVIVRVVFGLYAVGFAVIGIASATKFSRRLAGITKRYSFRLPKKAVVTENPANAQRAPEVELKAAPVLQASPISPRRSAATTAQRGYRQSTFGALHGADSKASAATASWAAEKAAERHKLRIFVFVLLVIGAMWASVFIWVLIVGKLSANQFLFYLWFLQVIEAASSIAMLVLLATDKRSKRRGAQTTPAVKEPERKRAPTVGHSVRRTRQKRASQLPTAQASGASRPDHVVVTVGPDNESPGDHGRPRAGSRTRFVLNEGSSSASASALTQSSKPLSRSDLDGPPRSSARGQAGRGVAGGSSRVRSANASSSGRCDGVAEPTHTIPAGRSVSGSPVPAASSVGLHASVENTPDAPLPAPAPSSQTPAPRRSIANILGPPSRRSLPVLLPPPVQRATLAVSTTIGSHGPSNDGSFTRDNPMLQTNRASSPTPPVSPLGCSSAGALDVPPPPRDATPPPRRSTSSLPSSSVLSDRLATEGASD